MKSPKTGVVGAVGENLWLILVWISINGEHSTTTWVACPMGQASFLTFGSFWTEIFVFGIAPPAPRFFLCFWLFPFVDPRAGTFLWACFPRRKDAAGSLFFWGGNSFFAPQPRW